MVGLSLAGYFIWSGSDTPTPQSAVAQADPAVKPNDDAGKPPPPVKPTPPDTDRLDDLRQKVPAAGPADALRLLAPKPDDPPAVAAWKNAWRPVVTARMEEVPAEISAGDLVRFADRLAAYRLTGPDGNELDRARGKLLARYAAKAVPKLATRDEFEQVRPALETADPDNDWVRAGLTEAKLEAGEKPAFTAAAPPGYAAYLKAVLSGDGIQLAAAVPAGTPDWLTPRRAGRLADGLATAVVGQRVGGRLGEFGDQSERVAGWLAKLGSLTPGGVPEAVAGDVVLLADKWPALKGLAERGSGGRATLAALRQQLAAPGVPPKGLLDRLTDVASRIGPDADDGTKSAAADLLADAGRAVFRHRDEWKKAAGFGTPADNLHRAGELFKRAAELSSRPEDFAWQGLMLVAVDPKTSSGVLENLANRGGDGPAALTLKGIVAARRKDRNDRPAAVTAFRDAVGKAKADPAKYSAELVLAYNHGGHTAILEANDQPAGPTRTELIASAITWGEALAKLEPLRADGPIIAGCAHEDRGWLDNLPVDKGERCGAAGPYAKADEWFQKAAGLACDTPDAAASNRGRNLFKWAEDDCQLGKYAPTDTAKSAPDRRRLDDATTALKAVGSNGPLAPEARYWLAEVALLRLQGAERQPGGGDLKALRQAALDAVTRVLPPPGQDKGQWQIEADKLVNLHLGDAQRLEKSGDLLGAASAVGRAAAAAAANELPKSQLSGLYVRQAWLLMAVGEKDEAKLAASFAAAKGPLTRALRADPQNVDLWLWRFNLGKVEMAAAQKFKAAKDLAAAAARYAVATNHLREAQEQGNIQSRRDARVRASYDKTMVVIGKCYDEIDLFLPTVLDDSTPLTGLGAACRLARLDLQVEADRSLAVDKRQPAVAWLSKVRTARTSLDDDVVTAAEEMSVRIQTTKAR